MSNKNFPTAAALLIDALTPAQRAILHNALLIQQNAINDEKTATENSNMQRVLKDRCILYYNYILEQNTSICNHLFAECFIDDLEPLNHFVTLNPHLKPVQNTSKQQNSFS